MDRDDKLITIMAVLYTFTACVYRIAKAPANIAQVIATLIGLYLLVKNWNEIKFDSNHFQYVKYFAIFALCLVPSVFVSTDVKYSITKLLEFHFYRPLIFVFIILFVKQRKLLQNMLIVVFSVEALDSLCMVYQFLVNHVSRPNGFGENPLNMTAVLLILIPAVAIVAINKEYFGPRLSNVSKVLFISYLSGFAACQNRSLWLIGPLTTIGGSFKYIVKSLKSIIVLVVVLIIGLGIIANNQRYRDRIVSITNTTTNASNLHRFYVWEGAFNIYKDYPITGVGITQFEHYYLGFNYKLPQERSRLPHAHNLYLQVASECGTIGLVGLFTMIYGFILTSIKSYRNRSNPVDLIILSINIGFICLFGIFEPSIMFANSGIRFYWLILACLLQWKNLVDKERI